MILPLFIPGKTVVRDAQGLRDLDTESAGGTEKRDTRLEWQAGLWAPSAQLDAPTWHGDPP